VQDPLREVSGFSSLLPYFRLLESALSARSGQAVTLLASRTENGELWYWADLPAAGAKVRVGFPASRVAVQPSLALLLILSVGALVTLVTSAWLAHRLIAPLSRLSAATQRIGQGQRLEPLPETGPAELATLAREFNRMGEQVEELLTNRTTLLAGISHDLRTPLSRIQLALGMLSEKPDKGLLERVLRDVEGMNDLIGRCLEVSRDFAEKESVELDLCDLLAGVAMEFAHTGAEIRGHKGPDCRLRVRPLALKRILSNLVDNAQRYGAGQPSTSNTGFPNTMSRSASSIVDRALQRRSVKKCFSPSIGWSPRAAAAPAAAAWAWPSCANSPPPTAGRSNSRRGPTVAPPPACGFRSKRRRACPANDTSSQTFAAPQLDRNRRTPIMYACTPPPDQRSKNQ
jgi:HAMP domain-containing protein